MLHHHQQQQRRLSQPLLLNLHWQICYRLSPTTITAPPLVALFLLLLLEALLLCLTGLPAFQSLPDPTTLCKFEMMDPTNMSQGQHIPTTCSLKDHRVTPQNLLLLSKQSLPLLLPNRLNHQYMHIIYIRKLAFLAKVTAIHQVLFCLTTLKQHLKINLLSVVVKTQAIYLV